MTSTFSFSTRMLAPVMAALLAVVSCLTFTGCSYSQDEVTAAVARIENGLKTTQSLLPQANIIQADLQVVAPEVAEYLAPILANADPALQKLIDACEAYQKNPGSDAYQAILNGLDAVTAQVDQAALKIAGVKNPNSQRTALTFIALVSTGLHVGLGLAQNFATKKQVKAMPAIARVDFEKIRPLLNREYAREQLAGMGYDADRALASAGL